MKEKWKAVEGFENYKVSSFGRVEGPGRSKQGRKLLNPYTTPKGYLKVCLSKNSKQTHGNGD